jgi:hypothetical protein
VIEPKKKTGQVSPCRSNFQETQDVARNYPLLPALLQPLPKSQLQKPFTGGRFFMG